MSTTETADLAIRRATADDAAALSALATRLTDFELPSWRTPDEISSADAAAMIEAVRSGGEHDEVMIGERGGIVVGCLHVRVMTDFFGRRHAHISVIATTESAAGTGVGRALMEYAERWARTRALALLTLNVFAANARARRFYERAGYIPEIVKYAKPLTPV